MQNIDTATEALLVTISEALLEKKAENVLQLDLRGLSSVADFFVICHAQSDTQVKALYSNVLEKCREELGEYAWQKEGHQERRWVTIDYVNVVVHIFTEELREYYNIEKMWSDAPKKEIYDEQ